MANQSTSGWTEERTAQLTQLWHEGLSFSCIAAEIGGVSRNAAIGKASRMGLTGRAPTKTKKPNYSPRQKHNAHPERAAIRVVEAAIAAEFYAEEVVDLSAEQKAVSVTFFDLKPHHCKWPYGDPRKPDFVFCGCDRAPDSPYCRAHMRIGTRPA